MIYQIQNKDVNRHTLRIANITVVLPDSVGKITSDHIGKLLRYRPYKPVGQQVDIVDRGIKDA